MNPSPSQRSPSLKKRYRRMRDTERTMQLYRTNAKYKLKVQLRAMRSHYQNQLAAGHKVMKMAPWKWETDTW